MNFSGIIRASIVHVLLVYISQKMEVSFITEKNKNVIGIARSASHAFSLVTKPPGLRFYTADEILIFHGGFVSNNEEKTQQQQHVYQQSA